MKTNGKEYEYLTLSEIYNYSKIENKFKYHQSNGYNFFGVISSASYPRCIFKNDFQVYLTVIDSSANNHSSLVVIDSDESNTVPLITMIGNIIRVHRGLKSIDEKNIMKLKLDIRQTNKIKSSWAIFSSSPDDYKPISTSSKRYSFHQSEKKLITQLREWSIKFFFQKNPLLTENLTTSSELKFEKIPQNIIVKIKEKTLEQSKVLISFEDDKKEDLLTLITDDAKKKFDYITKGDICLITFIRRCKTNKVLLCDYSHILLIPHYCFLFREFELKYEESRKLKQLVEEIDFNYSMVNVAVSHPIVANEIIESYQLQEGHNINNVVKVKTIPKNYVIKVIENVDYTKQVFYYKDLIVFGYEDAQIKSFICEFMVSCVVPCDVREFVKVYCRTCHKLYSTNDYINNNNFKGYFCLGSCKDIYACKLVYHVHFFGRLEYNKKKHFNFILLTIDDEGVNFFGSLAPDDLYTNTVLLSKLKEINDRLLSCFSYIRVELEPIAKDGEVNFRIIGNYELIN